MIRSRLWVVVAVVTTFACRGNPAEEEAHAGESSPDVVVLDSLQLASANVQYATVQPLPPDTLHLTGSVTYDAARVAAESCRPPDAGPDSPGSSRNR